LLDTDKPRFVQWMLGIESSVKVLGFDLVKVPVAIGTFPCDLISVHQNLALSRRTGGEFVLRRLPIQGGR
jgi:hypothetical protein